MKFGEVDLFFASVITSVKILKNILFQSCDKKKRSVKKSKNVSVKTLDCPWKGGKKCAWKWLFLPWKKEKNAKSGGSFDFNEKKKLADSDAIGINGYMSAEGRVKHQLNQAAALLSFGWVFGVQLYLLGTILITLAAITLK